MPQSSSLALDEAPEAQADSRCPSPRHTFKKRQRILHNHEFRMVTRHGKRRTGEFLIIEVITWRNPRRPTQLGITVSRKYGDSVHRNRFKRWIREIFRTHYEHFGRGVGVVVIPRPAARQATFLQIQEEFLRLGQAGVSQEQSAKSSHKESS